VVPEFIILHTAASGAAGVVWDVSCAEIDRWHRAEKWDCVGYHYVVRLSGKIEVGRAEWRQGAHCLGYNARSLGVCFSGHGDFMGWAGEQLESGLALVLALAVRYRIPACRVLGHRETGALKSCPGRLVNVGVVRKELESRGVPRDVLS